MAVLDIIRRFREAGGIVAVGNDFNDRSMKERLPLVEMRALLDAGMTPMEVIEAATRNAAIVSGAEDLGTLQPGKLADLIVVDSNPLEDIEALARIRLVILDGEVAYEKK
jgi:imidazolonepropionase-like amidohydrolase